MEPTEKRSEEIYLCKCLYPLSYSSLSEKFLEIYKDTVLKKLEEENKIDLNIHKFIFASSPNNEHFSKYCFKIDMKKNEIFCRECNASVGFIINDNKNLLDISTLLGFLELNKIKIKEIGMKNKRKELPVISQAEYIVLTKLKQLRYYVKQMAPTLRKAMGIIGEEKQNIDEYDNQFEKYKLNLVYNQFEKIEKEKKKSEEKEKKDIYLDLEDD